MSRRCPVYILAILSVSLAAGSLTPGSSYAQCYGSLSLEPDFFQNDYLVRLAVHFGGEYDIPGNIMCSRPRYPGEEIVEVPIWFYNAHEGILSLEFAVESNDSLLGFTPNDCWDILQSSIVTTDAGIHQLNLKLIACRILCGPGLAGWALVKPAPGSDQTWINLLPNRVTQRMRSLDGNSVWHYMYSPHHGGFIGSNWLYTCQEPICEEPNESVVRLIAEADYGHWVTLIWWAGGGNTTMIRARLDRFPTGYNDGRLVAEMPSTPGQRQGCYDTEAPLSTLVYYTAFSLTKVGGVVTLDSFVECAAVDTAMTTSVIATEPASWGAIKTILR